MKTWMVFLLLGVVICACTKDSSVVPPVIAKGEMSKAVVSKNYDRLRELLSAGADINENTGSDEDAVSPLMVAAALGDAEMVRFLVAHGASTSATYQGYSAIDFAFLKFGDESEVYKALTLKKGGN